MTGEKILDALDLGLGLAVQALAVLILLTLAVLAVGALLPKRKGSLDDLPASEIARRVRQ